MGSERFQLAKLSEEKPVFLNPDNATKLLWAAILGKAIQFPTVSRTEIDQNFEELKNLQDFLISSFPWVFKDSKFVEQSFPNNYSILLRVQGSHETIGDPYLLCAHLDVVPTGERERWLEDPFLGEIIHQDGQNYIFGRGAIDDKHSVVGILQALEAVLSDGGQPKRTLYVAFGHDEEVSGFAGAGHVSVDLEKMLQEREEQLDFLLDEGMFVMQGVVPGVSDPVIYIGVVEKGWTTVQLSVSGEQSHSSAPPRESTIGILANAVAKLEEEPSPARFMSGPEYDTFAYLAPHASFLYKMILSNLWLLSGAVSSVLSSSYETDAIQRTTTAVTMFNAGFKENVMPSSAEATVNHRIHPTETVEDVLEHDREVIDDSRVKISKSENSFNPPPISPYANDIMAFQVIANAALQVFPEGHIAPGTLIANTDTKHYQHLVDKIYRFTPAFITKNDTKRFHGFNERISVENFVQTVEFYHRLIKNADTQIG